MRSGEISRSSSYNWEGGVSGIEKLLVDSGRSEKLEAPGVYTTASC